MFYTLLSVILKKSSNWQELKTELAAEETFSLGLKMRRTAPTAAPAAMRGVPQAALWKVLKKQSSACCHGEDDSSARNLVLMNYSLL